MKTKTTCYVILMWCSALVHAQDRKASIDSLLFFVGKWEGQGAFASGKKIEATANFQLVLDGNWISYEHIDRYPGQFKAKSMWGIDRNTKRIVAVMFDNFQGYRTFETAGWSGSKLIITTHSGSDTTFAFQHFVYEKLTANSFKMTYEISKDAIIWKLGDSLVFKRQ